MDPLVLLQQQACQWGRLRVVIRSETGGISELIVNAEAFKMRGEWLNIENAHFHLHIHWVKVSAAWFIQKGRVLRSVHFVDAAGNAVFNLSLVRQEGEFEATAEQFYQQCFQQQKILNAKQ